MLQSIIKLWWKWKKKTSILTYVTIFWGQLLTFWRLGYFNGKNQKEVVYKPVLDEFGRIIHTLFWCFSIFAWKKKSWNKIGLLLWKDTIWRLSQFVYLVAIICTRALHCLGNSCVAFLHFVFISFCSSPV